jgi:NhaP-type Na+/H+ or K+/H+ antiporter
MLTWVVFGGPLLSRLLDQVTWPMVIYALLSLTVIRMVPVFLSLSSTGMGVGNKLFIGWFGPRGLASVVFGVIVFDAGIPGRETIAVAVVLTVLLSIIAHGATANPLIAALSADSRPGSQRRASNVSLGASDSP